MAPKLLQHAAAVGIRVGIVRPYLKCAIVARHGLVKAPEFLQCDAAVAPGLGMVRPDFQRLIEAVDRIVKAPQFLQYDAAVVVGIGTIRREIERALVACPGLLEAPETLQHIAVVIVCGRVQRLRSHGASQQLRRVRRALRLSRNDAEQLQRPKMIRVGLQDPLAKLLCPVPVSTGIGGVCVLHRLHYRQHDLITAGAREGLLRGLGRVGRFWSVFVHPSGAGLTLKLAGASPRQYFSHMEV